MQPPFPSHAPKRSLPSCIGHEALSTEDLKTWTSSQIVMKLSLIVKDDFEL